MLRFSKNLNRIAVMCFNLTAIIMFSILSIYSLFFTEVDETYLFEYVYEKQDSVFSNLLWIVITLFVFWVVYKLISKYEKLNIQKLAVAVSILVAIIGMCWVYVSKVLPYADSLYICEYTGAFNHGDFSSLERGGYVSIYRQQLGIITLFRVIFLIFGDGNYVPFQYLNAIMAGLLVFAGYKITEYLSDRNKTAEFIYLLFMITCIPLYGYIPFLYGEIIHVSFMMLAAWMLLSCIAQFSYRKCIFLGLFSGLAVQIRKNALIIIIAFLIVMLLKLSAKNVKSILCMMISTAAGVFILWGLITSLYWNKIPEDSKPMPALLHIAMGLNWDGVNPGYFNGYNTITYAVNDFDVRVSKAAAREKIREFIQSVKEKDGYFWRFSRHKMTGQWNAPMYQSLYVTFNLEDNHYSFADNVYSGKFHDFLEEFTNIYQLLVYVSIIYLLVKKRKLWSEIEKYVLLIGVFGGFLFSFLWEARARYIFPYFIVMIPYACVGIYEYVAKKPKKYNYKKRNSSTKKRYRKTK